MSTRSTTTIPEYKQKLNARRAILEVEAQVCERKLKADTNYFVKQAPNMLKDEVVDSIVAQNPLMSKLMGLLFGNRNKERKSHDNRNQSTKALKSIGSNAFQYYLLPLLYSLGTRKILSYSLRNTGRLVRFALQKIFKRRRNR